MKVEQDSLMVDEQLQDASPEVSAVDTPNSVIDASERSEVQSKTPAVPQRMMVVDGCG